MKKSFNKILSLLLALILIVSVVPISVSAASSTHYSHPICGSSCTCTDDSHGNYTSWTAWDGTTKMYNGNYYLTKDIVLDSTIVLDYGYQTVLCLNGYSITCEDAVFDIYSYRSIWVTDCKGTGKIESTGDTAIYNNKYFSLWNGTVKGQYNGIESYSGTTTFICGGRVEGVIGSAIYAYPGSDIRILGGEVYADWLAISGHSQSSAKLGNVLVSGGLVYSNGLDTFEVYQAKFTMTGGKVEGSVYVYDSSASATVSGGIITGELWSYAKTSITGGDLSLHVLGENATVSAGTFRESVGFDASNTTVSAGDFTDCYVVQNTGSTWIYGGYFDLIKVRLDAVLYLSGLPEINTIQIANPGKVSAQNVDQTGSYAGETIQVILGDSYSTYNWKDGDVVIKNVKSDAVAQKFVLAGEDSRWVYLERSGNNLVLRILPHGTWGNNATWGIKDGVLTVSGTGALDYTHSGNYYPWGKYTDNITQIVVEPGITKIPDYAFEYCENAETIILPETLTTLSLNAFNDCGSLNNLMIPSSVSFIEGTSNTLLPAFIRCESLTDMYYLGTAEEWNALTEGKSIISHNSTMTKHFLQYHETTATCTEGGNQAYYQFDDTSVYGGYYDEEKKLISQLQTLPALGHRVIVEQETSVTPLIVHNTDSVPFTLSNGTYYSDNHGHSSSSQIKIIAQYDCELVLNYGVSSESNYDKLTIKHNNSQKDAISGSISNKTLTLTLTAGDVVTVSYSKDGSQSSNQDKGWVALEYEQVTVMTDTDIPADTIEADCTNEVTCDYCQTVVKEAVGHRVIGEQEIQADPIIVENNGSVPFTLTNGTYYSNNKSNSSNSELTITAKYDCELTLNYGVSSEQNYDKLLIYHNNTNKATVSGSVSNRVLTLTLVAGDTVTVCYSKDGSVNSGQDRGWVSLSYDQVTIVGKTDIPVDTLEHECSDEIICDYCKMEVQGIVTHQMGEWITETEATCTETGSKYKICNNCDYSETQVIDAAGHSHIPSVTDSTCTEQGYTTYTCECGDSYVADYVDATGHSYTSEVTTPATHTSTGVMTFACECGDSYTETISKLEAHTYETVITTPTCTEQGYTTYTCECGDSYVADYVDTAGHSYTSEVTTPATHTSTGVMTYTCHCGDAYTETIDKIAKHEYESVVTAPTCEDKGYTTYTCECGDTYVADYVDETGHSHTSEVTTPATHTATGVMTYTCHCGDTYTGTIDKIAEHNYNATVTAPICTEQGYTTYTCECGDSYVDNYVDAKGHTAGEWVVTKPATTTQTGVKTQNCSVCGAVLETETIPVTVVKGKVHSVAISDVSLDYKASTTITPSITVDSGVKYTVTYSSSNPSVASVDTNGKVSTGKTGSATITVTVTDEFGNTVTDTCEVKVSYNWWQWIIVIVLFGWIWY